jgi:hypothetical protein
LLRWERCEWKSRLGYTGVVEEIRYNSSGTILDTEDSAASLAKSRVYRIQNLKPNIERAVSISQHNISWYTNTPEKDKTC